MKGVTVLKSSLTLVIDASVLRSAGETEHPVSKACRDMLVDIMKICHKIVSTPSLKEERQKHQSKFSRKWFASMTACKKVVRSIVTAPVEIDTKKLTPKEAKALNKDKHLLEAALAADHVIITRDKSIIDILAKTRKGARFLKDVKWVNPENEDSAALARK